MDSPLEPIKSKKKFRKRFLVWFNQAKFDIKAAEVSLDHGFNEWATYQAEQAVEKGIKAVLVHAGWKPPRIHKLQVLIGMANQANVEFRNTKFNFRHLESFTFVSRYPFLIPGGHETPHEQISKSDAAQAIDQAKDFVTKIGFILKNPVIEAADGVPTEEEIYSSANIHDRIEEVKSILIREFNPEKIILFGSFAREKHVKEPSTIDLLIIADSDLPFIQRISKARQATRGGLPVIEPLIYTPEEFRIMTEEEGESFFEDALKTSQTLYEKNNS